MYSKTWVQHVGHLKQVLGTLKQQQFFANLKKCSFGKTEVGYLGHIISKKGVSRDPQKVEAILQWPIPKTIKALHGFWGLQAIAGDLYVTMGRLLDPLPIC